ncbi:hypothetical protein PQX77_020783 [Marasmius sp. AFHP31]|nr:hypothetical protein PQX77_020783 [Marasmius sp. AFHP31]
MKQYRNTTSDTSAFSTSTFPVYTAESLNDINIDSQECPTLDKLQSDREAGYTLEWAFINDMQQWLENEEADSMVEFVLKDNRKVQDGTRGWHMTTRYICSWGNTGGKKNYEKKKHWSHKFESKKCNCKAQLLIRTYSLTATVLGKYSNTHNHPTGDLNAKFTQLSKETQTEIEWLLHLRVEPAKVLKQIQGGKVTEEILENVKSGKAQWNEFATRADVLRIQKMIEGETIQLAVLRR